MTANEKIQARNHFQILIIEDDIVSRNLLKSFIEKSIPGTKFHEADVLTDVLDIISANTIDCIILDYFLEDTDGLQILKSIRKKGIFIPVLILTNQTDDTIAAEMMKEGATDYFSKSILKEKNISTILRRSIINAIEMYRLWIEKRQARQALEMREKRYRGLIENSPILIMRFYNDDDEKMITFVNDGFCRYFNIERYEVLGDSVFSIIQESLREEFLEKINLISQNNPVVSFQHMGFGEKKNRWQFWTIEGIFDDEGEILEYQCMGEDATDLKNTQYELQNSIKKLEKMKILQDGDYFLTSLLLEPFQYNKSESKNTIIDIYVKQKKSLNLKNGKEKSGVIYASPIQLCCRDDSILSLPMQMLWVNPSRVLVVPLFLVLYFNRLLTV